jgi:hypothetical protein
MSPTGLALLLAIAFVPLWIGARVCGAKRSDVGTCAIALIVAAFFVIVLTMFVRHGLLISVVTSALAYTLVLGADVFRSFAIAAVQLVLTWIVVVVFAAAWIGPRLVRVFHV